YRHVAKLTHRYLGAGSLELSGLLSVFWRRDDVSADPFLTEFLQGAVFEHVSQRLIDRCFQLRLAVSEGYPCVLVEEVVVDRFEIEVVIADGDVTDDWRG